jgi:hypothetical protein
MAVADLSLRHMINNWQNIATSLAEPPRERKLAYSFGRDGDQ